MVFVERSHLRRSRRAIRLCTTNHQAAGKMFFTQSFNGHKCKAQLKMATIRISQQTNKKTQLMKMQKREIAKLLADGKEEKARIKTEGIIREDFIMEAYEVLSLLCDLLHERMQLIQSLKGCPPDLRESVCTIIYAAARTEIPELMQVRKMFSLKYGKEFAESALMNENQVVNDRIVHKLGINPPNSFLVLQYMKEIASTHDVEWEPAEDVPEGNLASPMAAPSGFSVQSGVGGGMENVYAQVQPTAANGAGLEAPDRVQCGGCKAILAAPKGVPRFACSNCGALLASPSVQTATATMLPPTSNIPMAESRVIDEGTQKGDDDNSGGGGGFVLPSPPSSVPRPREAADDMSEKAQFKTGDVEVDSPTPSHEHKVIPGQIQTITVPPGYGPGKIIKLRYNGTEHKIKIPETKTVGTTFDINLALLPGAPAPEMPADTTKKDAPEDSAPTSEESVPNFDELAARFAALKR